METKFPLFSMKSTEMHKMESRPSSIKRSLTFACLTELAKRLYSPRCHLSLEPVLRKILNIRSLGLIFLKIGLLRALRVELS